MASELREYAFAIPAGTLASDPASLDCVMPARVVEWITVLVPPGPNGTMGFQIANSSIPVIPSNPGAWIVSNDEVIHWPLENQITSGSWQVLGYNSGVYDHTIYVRFGVDPPGQNTNGAGGLVVPAPNAALSTLPEPAAGPDLGLAAALTLPGAV